jgi:hypothetical protein
VNFSRSYSGGGRDEFPGLDARGREMAPVLVKEKGRGERNVNLVREVDRSYEVVGPSARFPAQRGA